ncbi:alpha/beta hydrolase [Desertimonas flava]|uniref:alpha/beta hydrolase n=1 Tax=Desertimonas flava TaxID=2064846 RepID=UPI000E347C6D|nr:alpha/beta hydrolase [Desertimonas flava]
MCALALQPPSVVLVHGAWHGGECWTRVATRLRSRGVSVHAPTLTGLGNRASELTPATDLATHVDDVVGVLDAVDTPVVLVGHSYAGFVVRAAADRRPDLIHRLVLVDGWFGADGASLFDQAPDWFTAAMRDAAAREGDGWRIPIPDPSLVGVDDPADAAWLREQLTPHPLATFEQATELTGVVDTIDTVAITTAQQLLPFRTWASDAGWPVVDVDSGHDAMVTAPAELAAALGRLAGLDDLAASPSHPQETS